MGNSARNYWRWAAILALAALLRVWGPLGDASVRHPDEFFLVYWPLYFSTGDFNHQHTLTAFYPAFHYYLLGALYFLYFAALKMGGLAWSLHEWVAYQLFWGGDALVRIGRWVTVFFALGTVVCAGAVARRIWGESAGWMAALFTAVCAIHVRQSGLVAVDVPMTCWFVGAVWASLRLLHGEDVKAYLWAGVLVGLTAAAKYPGALVCSAVVAAHFSAGRGLLDRRLWASGAAAIGAFFIVTPYTFLDYAVFAGHFSREVSHLQQGHGQELGLGWWYYLRETLPAGLGWAGVVLMAYGAFAAWPSREGRVLLATFAGYYLVMGSGQLVFVRYALPLLVIGAILAGGAVARVGRPWRYALLLVGLIEPLHASVRIAELQVAGDTRSAAKSWVETRLPAGSTCCNFGGWAGDVSVRTIEGLWGRISEYERLWGREKMDEVRSFIVETGPRSPFYSYAIHYGNRQHNAGSMDVVRKFDCPYVILHRHALVYSTIDTAFAQSLAVRGELITRFSPGSDMMSARYDPIDAYYLPIGSFGELEKMGPEIEIWRIGPDKPSSWGTLPRAFAQAYVRGAATRLEGGEIAEALALVERGLALDADCADGYLVSARIMEQAGRDRGAIGFYERVVALKPERSDYWLALANAYSQLGDEDNAQRCYRRVLALEPDHPEAAALRRAISGEG
jgi:hypothetical protein